MKTALLYTGVALLGLLAGALVWRSFVITQKQDFDTLIVLPEPRIIADFALRDQDDEPFSLDGFRGRWSVVFVGFTSCPDVCPNTLFQLQQARQLMLEELPPGQLPQIFLLSVDPERDTPEKLADYLAYFDPGFLGVTGPDAQLRALSLQLGVAYYVEPHEPGATEYTVDHSASLLLLDPQGRLFGVLPAPHNAGSIAQDIVALIRQEA